MSTRIVKTLIAGGVLTGLIGCSAAEPPCLVQRAATGGYSILFQRQGAVPAGCTDVTIDDFANGNVPTDTPVSPAAWWDNWRFDLYANSLLVFRSDDQPKQPSDPDNAFVSQGTLPVSPTAENGQQICTSTDLSETDAQPDLFGIPGQEAYNIKPTEVKLLDGARYQGSQAQVTAQLTFGTCTATYVGIGATPSAFLEFVAPCRAGPNQDNECSPFADISIGRSTGTGYNPDYPMVCRLDIGLAFQYGPPPYCLEFDDQGNCTTPDPDTSQKGVCSFPAGANFPSLK